MNDFYESSLKNQFYRNKFECKNINMMIKINYKSVPWVDII